MTSQSKPRYKDAQKQRFYSSLLALAADRESEMYHQGRPRRGAGHRAAFWDGYAGLQRTANVVPGTLSAVAHAAGKQFAKTNPGIATEEAVWTPGVTRQGEPTKARMRVGFFMADATRALGGLANASNALMVLLAEGLVDSEPVVINDDVHTLYRLSGAKPPSVH